MERSELKAVGVYSLALFLLLISCYLLTYRGFTISQDTYYIFDSVESLVRRGTFELTYEYAPDFSIPADGGAPWLPSPQEPLNMYFVAPFYWIGSNLTGVGTAHVTWLFNIFMTAFTAVNFFWGGMWLGYSRRTAWLAGLMLGLSTLSWTYARYLFREPVMTFFLMWCFFGAVYFYRQWRAGRFPLSALLFTGFFFVLTFLSKEVAIALTPGLVLIALPPIRRMTPKTLSIIAIVIVTLIILFTILAIGLNQSSTRYSFDSWWRRLNMIDFAVLIETILGYQFSFSRSIWLHSPILLLALVGIWHVFKRGEWRLAISPLIMMLILSAAYVGYSYSWWGNIGWGPRYLLPLGPVLMVFVMEVMDNVIKTRRQWIMLGALAVFSALIQIIGMMPIPNYYTDMYYAGILPELNKQTAWGAYNWQWEYSPIYYHLQNFSFGQIDVAWHFANHRSLMVVLLIGLVGLSAGYVVWVLRGKQSFLKQALGGLALSVVVIGVMAFGMRSLFSDNRYIEDRHDVRELIEQLNMRVTPEQIVFVDRRQYQHAFMNYFKTPAIVAILPYSPGENYTSAPPTPEALGKSALAQIGRAGFYALNWASQVGKEVWLVASSSPFEETKIRPIERYLALTFYPVEEIGISERARAIHFFMQNVSAIEAYTRTQIFYNQALLLHSYALPSGSTYQAGDVIPLSIRWQPRDVLPEDYQVSIQLVASDGFVLTQRDSAPMGTFGKMSEWEVNKNYLDNHGLLIPSGAFSGEYTIRVVVYRWQDGSRLPYVDGSISGDVAVLTTITITD